MSDSFMYELEDIVWDEFVQGDDHIVPHPSDEHSFQGDSCKKPRIDIKAVSSDCGKQCNTTTHDTKEKEQKDFSSLNMMSTMLENNSWSHNPDSMFPASCDGDSDKDVTSLPSETTMNSNDYFKRSNADSIGNEFSCEDPILNNKRATVDCNSYNYTIGQTGDDGLSFLDRDHEDKESNDLLYNGWLDIGNFEDVDRMFGNCDSTFGIGGVGNGDNFNWFSSSDGVEGSGEGLRSDFKFSCPDSSSSLPNVAESHEQKLNDASYSINGSTMESASVTNRDSSQLLEHNVTGTPIHSIFVNGSKFSGSKNEIVFSQHGDDRNGGAQYKTSTIKYPKNENNGMINPHKKQSKHQNQSKAKTKASNKQNEDTNLSSGDTSSRVFSSIGIRKQKQNFGPNTFGYLQTDVPYMTSGYSHTSVQNALTPSGVKSENNSIMSLSPKESCYASNMVQPIESSLDPTLEARASICDPNSVQAHYSRNKLEYGNDLDGGIPAELGSSNLQDGYSVNCGSDETSVQASGFHQLQLVMEKLDLKTKLCIRDSLYRLARSAEQRQSSSSVDDRDTTTARIAEGPNKCAGFLDIETDTNPIDRSIAHLLFHRPSESSVSADPVSLKSHTMINGQMPTIIGQEEKTEETERKNG